MYTFVFTYNVSDPQYSLLKGIKLKRLYEHFAYQYGPGVTVQCLLCHCIHAAYQYDAPAPLLCILWRNTLMKIINSCGPNYNTNNH